MVGQIISGNGIKGCIPYLQNKKSLTQIVSNKFLIWVIRPILIQERTPT
jgi:hypothetical protein